ncbi:MAG: EAL domain-containing protein [Azoarcus sp.]|jgi:diguanylate cyclase (GGDEF)-like protein|nr:EAL domain-containing protein [Azoarcus sp.]
MNDQERIIALERKIVSLEKTNQALMDRVERTTASAASSYSLFEYNLALQHEVEEQTHELQERNDQLQQALEKLQQATDYLEIRIAERTRELSEANRSLSAEIEIRRIAEEKAQYLAGHDPLTGLANRMLFNVQMQKAVNQTLRSDKHGALLFFDLDRFKHINDTLGHAVGDALLVHMAAVLQARVRKMDTAARLGGDEFAVIMTEIEQPECAAVLAQDILRKLAEPVILLGNEIQVKSSIGIATFQRQNIDQDDYEQIIKNADMAMYHAKATGGMRYCFFEQSLQEKIDIHERINAELRKSLVHRRFVPYFQPLYQIAGKRVLYLEVQTRWNHPERGTLLADGFMGNAAKSGVTKRIDFQVFNRACAHAKTWENEKLPFGRISFNILPQYLERPDFTQNIKKILNHHRLSPQRLAFEISEYALLKNSEQISQTLDTLRDMGVFILVDHLEIERSTLKNLIYYPIDAIKIGHSLISHIGEAKINALIRSIAAVAHTIHLTLIAEVENDAQRDYMQTLDCEIIQNCKHARPMDADETRAYLHEHR